MNDDYLIPVRDQYGLVLRGDGSASLVYSRENQDEFCKLVSDKKLEEIRMIEEMLE